uniref:Equilibrative nucleoside transporter n=1 Tax=Eutreptiella gymnastica TaxID=73025 RepID=A0A7S1JA17_9EUGL|mmetsp:Transcript_79002/g.139544  ORF Transcript_79002/g.139544 Transcript_79002/m.139544 type:complete len:419 (+) Transcript_79002:136-1392(+)
MDDLNLEDAHLLATLSDPTVGSSDDAIPPNLDKKEARLIYWCMFYLSMSVLWSYQSLISAQHYYSTQFPDAGLAFWGIVAVGSTMFFSHVGLMMTGLGNSLGFTKCMVSSFCGFVVIGVILVVYQKASIIIGAFAIVGILLSLATSPLYALAGLFSTPTFTQAVNAGNGAAGFLNVTAETVIRLILLKISARTNSTLVSFQLFIALMMVLSLTSIGVWFYLLSFPVVRYYQELSASQMQLRESSSVWPVAKQIWASALINFVTLFVSLLLWPGLGCTLTPKGALKDLAPWYCSPIIVASFNYGDLIGRALPNLKWFTKLKTRALGTLTVLRALILPPLVYLLCRTDIFGPNSALILVAVLALGAISNGLVCTISMMNGPLMVAPHDRETAAYIMTAALFAGIAGGSTLSAVLDSLHLI